LHINQADHSVHFLQLSGAPLYSIIYSTSLSLRDKTIVGHDTCTCAAFHKAV